ncbi:iroquois-class homeodomain protein IRX-5-like isoform X1, partial [Lates japonicus]
MKPPQGFLFQPSVSPGSALLPVLQTGVILGPRTEARPLLFGLPPSLRTPGIGDLSQFNSHLPYGGGPGPPPHSNSL